MTVCLFEGAEALQVEAEGMETKGEKVWRRNLREKVERGRVRREGGGGEGGRRGSVWSEICVVGGRKRGVERGGDGSQRGWTKRKVKNTRVTEQDDL